MKKNISIFLKGCAIGIANIIPGVSGGTLAVVLGVYEQLLESVACIFHSSLKRRDYLGFLVTIGLGAGVAIISLARVVDYALRDHFHMTMFLFMGLIAGGIPSLRRSCPQRRLTLSRLLVFMVGLLIVLGPSLLMKHARVVPLNSAQALSTDSLSLVRLFFSSMLAGGAMIVPGVSGSLVLVLLGQYSVVIHAIKNFIMLSLLFVGLGSGFGIFLFSGIIRFCLARFPTLTYDAILGLLFASLLEVYPGWPQGWSRVFFSMILFVVGSGVSYGLSLSSRHE